MRERVKEENSFSGWVCPRNSGVRSSNSHYYNGQRGFVVGDFPHILFWQCLSSLSHDPQKHQAGISNAESRRTSRHLFGSHAETDIRGHGAVSVVFQEETVSRSLAEPSCRF